MVLFCWFKIMVLQKRHAPGLAIKLCRQLEEGSIQSHIDLLVSGES